jgi:hypothetical protein
VPEPPADATPGADPPPVEADADGVEPDPVDLVSGEAVWVAARTPGVNVDAVVGTPAEGLCAGSLTGLWLTRVSVLLAVAGSNSLAATLATLVMVPPTVDVGLVVTETRALAPFASVPTLHVTTLACCTHVPWLAVAETKIAPAGTVSLSTVLVAADGPLFKTLKT